MMTMYNTKMPHRNIVNGWGNEEMVVEWNLLALAAYIFEGFKSTGCILEEK